MDQPIGGCGLAAFRSGGSVGDLRDLAGRSMRDRLPCCDGAEARLVEEAGLGYARMLTLEVLTKSDLLTLII